MRWLTLFFIRTILSLSPSPPVFSNSIAIIFFFPQINWNNFFSFHFGNNIATNQLLQFFFLQFSATSLPKLLLNFSPSFRQLGCHNSPFFFLSHFWQLGCHNSYFLSPHSPTISTTWLPQLVSFQPLFLQALHLEVG